MQDGYRVSCAVDQLRTPSASRPHTKTNNKGKNNPGSLTHQPKSLGSRGHEVRGSAQRSGDGDFTESTIKPPEEKEDGMGEAGGTGVEKEAERDGGGVLAGEGGLDGVHTLL